MFVPDHGPYLCSDLHKSSILCTWISCAFQNCLIDVEEIPVNRLHCDSPKCNNLKKIYGYNRCNFSILSIVMLINFLNHVECVFLRRGRIHRSENRKQKFAERRTEENVVQVTDRTSNTEAMKAESKGKTSKISVEIERMRKDLDVFFLLVCNGTW